MPLLLPLLPDKPPIGVVGYYPGRHGPHVRSVAHWTGMIPTLEEFPEFNPAVTRQLVTADPLLAYTVIRHQGEAEEHWLKQVFALEVRKDPGLRSRYHALASLARADLCRRETQTATFVRG